VGWADGGQRGLKNNPQRRKERRAENAMGSRFHTKRWTKSLAGSLVVAVLVSFVLLVVAPVLEQVPRVEAQEAPGAPGGMPGPGGTGAPPGGMPGGGMPGMGMPGGGMPGGGAPGGGMPGGGMPGMGMPGVGAAGPGAPGAAPGAPPTGPAAAPKPPLEPWRENPFLPLGVGAAGARVPMPWVRRYGPNWYNYPVGIGVAGLPMIERPGPRPTPLPPPAAERFMRVSSIVWTGGQAIASCELPDGRTVVVKPGEFVGEWQVVEILRDRVRVRHRTRGDVQEVFLRPKEKLPEMPAGAFGAPGGQLPSPGMMPAPAGQAAPMAPGRGLLRPGQ